ncbi:hypothetical protein Hypma_016131 [Hypsizygus marmoreus]|uniref:Uncharacterized protein n=1 Tax=Hypsizygus marmoreus TaxID=39966 RepID=A0A369KCH1_HYPMA|nr:hypothetical protein Hypma_016131 [Hypsizygus marmoreus]
MHQCILSEFHNRSNGMELMVYPPNWYFTIQWDGTDGASSQLVFLRYGEVNFLSLAGAPISAAAFKDLGLFSRPGTI